MMKTMEKLRKMKKTTFILISALGGGGGGCLQGCDATGAAVIKCFHSISAISSNRISMYFQLYFLEVVEVFGQVQNVQ